MKYSANYEILDSAISLEILKQDLKILPKPTDTWNTIDPVEGGHYIAGHIEYVYTKGELVEFNEDATPGNITLEDATVVSTESETTTL